MIERLRQLLDLTGEPFTYRPATLDEHSLYLEYGRDVNPDTEVRVAVIETASGWINVTVSAPLPDRAQMSAHLRAIANIAEETT